MPRKMIKQDERYHDTLLLLKKYRDVVWSLSVSVEHAKSDFREWISAELTLRNEQNVSNEATKCCSL